MKIPVAGEMRVIQKKYGRIVFEQDFTMPDGRVENFFLFSASALPAIVLPITTDNKVVAIRQFRFGANEIMIEIPGGNRKPDQTLEDCAKVEVLEETGYDCEKLFMLGEGLWFDPASWRAHYAAFLATGCHRVKSPEPDLNEFFELVEVPWDKWLTMIFRGEIRDSKTIVTTFLALRYLGLA